jgi:hypothetical protein
MPTIAQVKVNTVGTTVRGNSNMIELTGYDHTNRRGFKKAFFETKKDGGRTRNAEVSDNLKQDDWVEITMDDSSYKNVQSIKVIAQPPGGDVPSQGGGESPTQGGGGGSSRGSSSGSSNASDKMSKAEWAAKDAKKELGVARSVALKAAISAVSSDGKGFTKTKMVQITKMIDSFTSYLLTGDFEGKLPEVPAPPAPPVTREPGDEQETPPVNEDGSGAPIDDDIPF